MEPPSCDLIGAQPPYSVNFLELIAYMNHYSVIKGCFRFIKLWRNRYITRYRVVKLRCLLDNIMISLHKYVDLSSKFFIKMHTRREPPLAIGLLLHHWGGVNSRGVGQKV